MVVIDVDEKDKEKVLVILLGNGRFRSLGENRFDIIDNSDEVLKKLESIGIKPKKLDG